MKKYDLDKELKSLGLFKTVIIKPLLPIINLFMKIIFRLKSDKEVLVQKNKISSYKNGKINVYVITPRKVKDEKVPALVYYHGGAFCFSASSAHYKIAKEYAKKISCKVIFTDYRLTPKYPFPYPVEDCFFGYKWMLDNHVQLNIDIDKIFIGGDSAGGALAIAVNLLAIENNLIKPKSNILIYPVTDRRMLTDSMKRFYDTPLWNSKLNKKMWEMYLKYPCDNVSLASPIENDQWYGFPNTYIEVAEFDCLKDEGIAFAKILEQNNVNVKLVEVNGTCHGFETAYKSNIVKEAINRRVNYINEIINEN